MARGKHLFPFRTEPLSPSAPMVLGSQGPGRVGRRRFLLTLRLCVTRAGLCFVSRGGMRRHGEGGRSTEGGMRQSAEGRAGGRRTRGGGRNAAECGTAPPR